MLKKILSVFVAATMALATLAGCKGEPDISSGVAAKDFPVTLGGVTLKNAPSGVVVLSPNLADVILTLGYEIVLKGKSEDCTQSDLSVLPNISADDVDAIKKAGADLVLSDKKLSDETIGKLDKQGIHAIAIQPAKDRADLERLYRTVGAVIKGGNTGYQYGEKTAKNVFYTIDDINRVIPETNEPVTVCYLYDLNGGAATGDTIAGKLIEYSKLTNVFQQDTNNKASLDSLKLGDPKYIFCAKGLKAKLASSDKFKNLTAVKEKRVFEVEPGYMLWQGRGMIDAVSKMAGTVYPQLLEGTSSITESSSEPASSKAPTSSASSSSATTSSAKPSSSSGTASTALKMPGGTLKQGDNGDAVLTLQKRLAELNYMFVKCTGNYTASTTQAVKDFQLLNGMTTTGVADEKMQKALFSADAKRREKH